ncbi:MAG: thiamine phosphate synthase [Rhodobacteraceae bacterium]|nr:thiamine phosphate synthase [Paracoccaceae bacterium]
MLNSTLPEIYLITPPITDLEKFLHKLQKVIEKNKISCVRLRLSSTKETEIIDTTLLVKKLLDKWNIPLLIENHYKIVTQLGLHGVHLTNGGQSILKVRQELGTNYIIGAFCGNSKHKALIAAENGADYVSIGPLSETKFGNEEKASIETFEWWSEVIEIPIVAEGNLDQRTIKALLKYSDFIAIGNEIWDADDFELRLNDLLLPLTQA